jgi:hypothetical protein
MQVHVSSTPHLPWQQSSSVSHAWSSSAQLAPGQLPADE